MAVENRILYIHLCVIIVLHFPVWTNSQATTELNYQLQEEQPVGTVLGNVKHDLGLERQYGATISNELHFQFMTQAVMGFMIEDKTGKIKTTGRIDREQLCISLPQCAVVTLIVAIHPIPEVQMKVVKVKIEILDVNDHSPLFSEAVISYQILESAKPGQGFILPTASDPDSPTFSVQGYTINSDSSDKFQLVSRIKVDGSTSLKLVLKQELNRELEDSYTVHIVASDGGNPPQTGTLTVNIIVTDINDNAPSFVSDEYNVSILENIPVYTTIIQVSASDPDEGEFGEVIYDFSPPSGQDKGALFAINATSGEIFTTGEIDYEKKSVHYLVVTARDKGFDSFPTEANVVVKIMDVNDHMPAIAVNTLKAADADLIEVQENATIGTYLAYVKVRDQDAGLNGRVNCSLNHSKFRLTQQDEAEYQILSRGLLDRERVAQHNLAIRCADHGSPSQVSFKHIEVLVTDVNDNSPVFDRSHYAATIFENNQLGQSILQVNASDLDAGRNAIVHYTVPNAVKHLCQIHPVTGVLTAKVSFDREKYRKVGLNITAFDQGFPPRSALVSVVITIADVNDEAPRFAQDSYSFGVPENKPSGLEVGRVTAYDPDSYPYNQLTYSILSGDKNMFIIGKDTGKLETLKALDREQVPSYHLVILAQDQLVAKLSGTVSVTVYVDDVNDHYPEFEFPTLYNNTVSMSNRVPIGYEVTIIKAFDEDIGVNGELKYSISKGNDAGIFSLDGQTGLLSVNIDVRQIVYESFRLLLEATDSGSPARKQSAVLNIIVNESIDYKYDEYRDDIIVGSNLTIVLLVACIAGVVIVILVVAIAIVVFRRREESRKVRQHANRMEAIKMLTAKDMKSVSVPDSKTDVRRTSRRKLRGTETGQHQKEQYLADHQSGSELQEIAVNSVHLSPKKQSRRSLGNCEYGEVDRDSLGSGQGSTADSGRGTSESGDPSYKALNGKKNQDTPSPNRSASEEDKPDLLPKQYDLGFAVPNSAWCFKPVAVHSPIHSCSNGSLHTSQNSSFYLPTSPSTTKDISREDNSQGNCSMNPMENSVSLSVTPESPLSSKQLPNRYNRRKNKYKSVLV